MGQEMVLVEGYERWGEGECLVGQRYNGTGIGWG